METKPSSPDAQTGSTMGSRWKFPFLLALVVCGMLLWNRNQQPTPPPRAVPPTSGDWTPSPLATEELVGLEIDFGNGARRQFDALPWHAEMTVADVMAAAHEFRPGISYVQIGEGAGGFLAELEGLKNEGASGRNWQYDVAGTPGNMSFCLRKVARGELVRWRFAAREDGL